SRQCLEWLPQESAPRPAAIIFARAYRRSTCLLDCDYFNGFFSAFAQVNRTAAALIGTHEFRIPPGAGRNVFPREHTISARSDAQDLKASRCIRCCVLVQLAARTVRGTRNERDFGI